MCNMAKMKPIKSEKNYRKVYLFFNFLIFLIFEYLLTLEILGR